MKAMPKHNWVNQNLTIMHQNTQYLSNKIDMLTEFLQSTSPDIVAISEHGLKKDVIPLCKLEGYTLVSYFCREKYKGGGTAIYSTRNMVGCKSLNWITTKSIEKTIEVTGIEIKCDNNKLIILALYRSPCGDMYEFLNLLTVILEQTVHKCGNIILVGDLNINTLENGWDHKQLLDIINAYNLTMTIKVPTRVTESSATTIDQIITNIPATHYHTNVLNSLLSDHYAQYITIHITVPSVKSCYKESRDLSEDNIIGLCTLIQSETWLEMLNESVIDKKWNSFYSTFNYYYNLACPKVRRNMGIDKKPCWINKDVRVAREILRNRYDLYIRFKSYELKNNYKLYKKEYKKIITMTKANYIQKILNRSEGTSKALWRIVNGERDSLNNNLIRNISLSDGKHIVNKPYIVSNIFNKTFVETAKNLILENNIVHSQTSNKIDNLRDSFVLMETTEAGLIKIIGSMASKKSAGLDDISPYLLKKCIPFIVTPLLNLINASIRDGIFPSILKKSVVSPIYKKGSAHDANNYRPITLIPSFSKVLEKVVVNQLIVFLDKHNIINKSQFGFRKNHSTQDAIATITENIIDNLNHKINCNCVSLDLSKAFDCIQHNTLLDKLYKYGIRGIPLQLIKSYLANRSQQVKVTYRESNEIKEFLSSSLSINCGVPQGSVLGPLLFILYINDFPYLMQGKTIIFADDTSILNMGQDTKELQNNTLLNIGRVEKYFDMNYLFINPIKTQCIFFQTKQSKQDLKFTIQVKNREIESVRSLNFLGVTIDSTLSWDVHIDKICNQISRNLFLLNRLTNILDLKSRKMLYYGLIYPLLSYGIIVWGHSSKVLINRIFILQKRAIRLTAGLKPLESCRASFRQHRILTVYSIYILQTILFVINKCNCTTNKEIHTHNTRHKNDYHKCARNLDLYNSKPSVAGCTFYNKLPNYVKQLENRNQLIRELKRLLIKGSYYSIEEYINDKF
jgi:exonuclease III